MIIGNIIKPGKLQSHKYSQCYWRDYGVKNMLTFVSYNSAIFSVIETDHGLTFYPCQTSPSYSRTTARQTLWALYELGYGYKQAHNIIDELKTKHIVKA